MNESRRLRRLLIAEAVAAGQGLYPAYYLFESYEDVLPNWPRREHEDLVCEHFCESCAFARVDEARSAGLPVVDHNVPWYDRPDEEREFYDGPFFEHSYESDSPRWCADCGKVLNFSPTEYCIGEEIEAFSSSAERPDGRIYASDLAVLAELLDGASGSKHESELIEIAAKAHRRFYVPAGDELRSRLPTLAKIKQSWKQACEAIRFERD